MVLISSQYMALTLAKFSFSFAIISFCLSTSTPISLFIFSVLLSPLISRGGDSGQPVVSGQWSVVSAQWSVVSGQ